jgi:hypothetical protein
VTADPHTVAVLSLVFQAVNMLVLPAVIGMARYLWRVERRLLLIEHKIGLHQRADD